MKTRIFRLTAASTIAVAGLALCHCAHASTFRVGGSGNSFTVSRSGDGTNFAETVSYRTVGLSDYGGQHFVAKYGTLTFAPNQTSTNVVVTETMPTTAAYKFQTGTSRYYRFEITDAGGFLVTNATRTLTTGTRVTASDAFGVKNLTIQSGEYTADDDGYDSNGYKSVSSNGYFAAAAPRTYFQHVNAQLRMTLSMSAKENDDGYQYLQLLFDNTSTCDDRSSASDGNPGTPNLSRYMAGFEIKSGSKDDSYKTYTFPVTNVADNAGATDPWGHGNGYPLDNQKFKAGYRATDGRLILPLDFSSIVLRLNASGKSGSDEWAAKSVVAHVQAVDTNAPYKIAASAAPGIHARGNAIYVSVAFSEPVTGTPSLTTSWGTLNYFSGSGSNVLTFKGTIPSTATGSLNVTGKSGTISDLAGNPIGATDLAQKNLATLDTSHTYAIAYDLAGGTLPSGRSNPYTYIYEDQRILLANPLRPGYIFAGWTGSNGTIPQTSVTVAAQSHGDLAYTANWKLNIPYIDADGTERICADYTVLTNATGNVTYGANGTEVWYVVTTNVNISGQLLFNGTAHLILCDGAILAVTNENGYAISSYSFAIYGQTNGTGTVTAIGGDSGIYAQYGAVTINGGTITATGNYGIYAYGGFVTINGGTITAAGASKGIYAYNRSVTINGGTVTATGNHGISGDSVTINGGTVTANATATSGTGIYAFYDVTINGGTITAEGASTGIYADNKSVTINGGTVTATATSNGYGIYANKGSVTINGGTVTANGRQYGIYANNFITLGWTNPTDSITASSYRGRSVSVKDDQRLTDGSNIYGGGSFDPSDIAGKTLGPAYSITLPEGVVASGVVRQDGTTAYALPDTAVTLSPAPGYAIGDVTVNGNALETGTYSFTASADAVTIDATVTPITYTVHFDAGGGEGAMPNQSFTYDTPQALSSNVFARMGYTFVGWHGVDGAIYPDCATVSNLTNAQDAVVSLVAKWGIPYIDEDGTEQICTDYTVITNAAGDVEYGANGEESWYVVTNAVTISGQLRFTGSNTNLILCDGATLTITNENGIAINANDLTIYGQTNGTGAIDAYGDCGILGRGNLTINSGSVTAAGKNGGGISASSVTINGGTVTANGKSSICIYANNDITINGGTVTANGTNGNGIRAQNGSVTLGWTKPTDSITASSYYANNGNVSVKSDQTLTDGSNIYESGNALNPSDLTGKTLRPAYSITLPAGVVASGVVTQDGTTAYALPGTNVTLSAATPGYAIGNVTVNGNAIDPVGGIYTFAADAASITVTATVGIPVPYIDEDGVERQCFSYTVLTNAAGDVSYGGGSGWYVVTNAVNISGQLYFRDNSAHLILCDGATLAVTNANGRAIQAGDLTIYGQTNGTGSVTATGGNEGIIWANNDVTINGGTVTANGTNGNGIFAAVGSVTINGGTVTANGGTDGNGIRAQNGSVTLGWTKSTDSITASSYSAYNGVSVKTDQPLTDGSDIYEGYIFDSSALAGKTLRPAYSISLPEGVVANGVVTQDGTTAYAQPGATVTLAAAAPGYAIGDITVNGVPLAPVGGVYSFTASTDGITVTAATVMTQWKALQTQLDAGGAVALANDVTAMSIDETLTVTNAVTLDLNGHTIDAYGRFCVIQVLEGGDITLTNSVEGAGAVTGGYGNYGGGVYVSGGAFTMAGGSITNNYADSYGGGVYVTDSGTFTISGGEISKNYAHDNGGGVYVDGGAFTMNGGTISSNSTYTSGGGVYVDGGAFTMNGGTISSNSTYTSGGGVYVDGGAFTMNGGTISTNTADCYSSNRDRTVGGGGVFVTGGTFAMTGGEILGNAADSVISGKAYGGGVCLDGGTNTMTGGTISGNFVATTGDTGGTSASASWCVGGGVHVHGGGAFTMSGGEISGNTSSKCGGGVSLFGNKSVVMMTGGTISGNTARCKGRNNAYGGGGVYINAGTFTLANSAISGNSTSAQGGGVYVYGGTFTVSGSSVVFGSTNSVGAASNVYLPSGKEIAVSNLTAGARIGVTTRTKPTLANPVTFATGAAAGDDAYFFSDIFGYNVELDDGNLQLAQLMAFPTYLEGADNSVRSNYVSWAARNGEDVDSEHEAAFLLNVAPWATPIELRIAGIEVVEGGARVRVAATAGGEAVDLSQINGVISVSAGDDLGALAPKAVSAANVTYSEGEATIFVPASAGRFVKAVIGVAAPAEGE